LETGQRRRRFLLLFTLASIANRGEPRHLRLMTEIRRAELRDLPAIIALLADDILGRSREIVSDPPAEPYVTAFQEIEEDPNQLLAVMVDGSDVVGTLQLSFIPGLARRGSKRGLIEAVRVASRRRGERLGERLFEWAITECRRRGCALVQLTTDRERLDAHRFYERLGFEPTHVGYKLKLGE
jgi:GNAT superfamily N-acetyltransferase